MKNIVIFCAWSRPARANYRKTILNSIPEEIVLSCFPAEKHIALKSWEKQAGGFFAWGFKGGQRSKTLWNKLEPRDCVLGFFESHYQVIAQLVGKACSDTFSNGVWGIAEGSSEERRYIIFVSKPQEVMVPASTLCPYLGSSYRGATLIGTERINNIVRDFGSVEAFVKKFFVDIYSEG